MKKIIFLIIISYTHSLAQNYGAWRLTDSLNIPRWHAASVELEDGNILVTGGLDSIGIRDAEIFDFKTEKWEQTNPMVKGRLDHKLVRLKNGNVLAIGGYGTKSCEIYDPSTRNWSLTDSLNYERTTGYTATLLDNGNVLVAGGYYLYPGSSKYLKSCEIYDVNSAQWVVTDSLKIDNAYHTATKLLNGKVLIAGGFSATQKALANCEIYDPLANQWQEAAPLNIARYDHSATLLPDGKVLITGGLNYANPQSPWLNSCELYDLAENTWTVVDSLLIPRANHSAIILKNGLLLIFGGDVNNSAWELYDPNNFLNVYIGNYSGNQYNPLVKLLPNGKVLSAGGMKVTYLSGLPIVSATNICYSYDPDGVDGVEEEKESIVRDFRLYQNYPNPFNPGTTIEYVLPKESFVNLTVYNSLGEKVAILVNEYQRNGKYKVRFTANVKNLASGIYFYSLRAGNNVITKKMILLR
ncbi:kelch repeat-containing protein [Melioribacteraceae bacterium 4301-Me]|uniref:kelch repeat-containing protein n=1 Tax=Pyranulibacter aquaticus TaxID=3163344 RepID=UPI00359A670D